MIRSAIKNYFANFKYVFSGMGVIYLAMIIAIFAFLNGAGSILANAAEVSVRELSDYLALHFQNVTLEILFSDGYLINFINGLLDIFRLNGVNIVLKLLELLFGLIAFVLFSMKAASFLMRRLIRRELRDGETKRGLLVLLCRFAASVASLSIALVLSYYWIYSVFVLLALFAVLKTFEQLFTTWYIHFRNSFKLKEIFQIRRVLSLLAANAVSVALNLAVIVILSLIFGVFFAILVAIPLVVYQFTVLDFTAVDYFRRIKTKARIEAEGELASEATDFSESSETNRFRTREKSVGDSDFIEEKAAASVSADVVKTNPRGAGKKTKPRD